MPVQRKIKTNTSQIEKITKEKADILLDSNSIANVKLDKYPHIPITPDMCSKFISHRLGYKPHPKIVLSTGEEGFVGVNHLDDQECEVTWQGGITGEIILE